MQVKFYPDYKIIINVANFNGATEQEKLKGNENSLKYFQIEDVIYSEELPRKYRTFMQTVLSIVQRKILEKLIPVKKLKFIDSKFIQPFFNIFGLYTPLSHSNYVKPRKSSSSKIFCRSSFENSEYFKDIRDILLQEIQPKYDVLPHNVELLNDICNSESVCVHIRRGDFLEFKGFNVCNEEYFITAMKEIRKEIPDCKFFVFSDDVDLVKSTMNLPFEVIYESKNNPAYESLRLMYNCKHFIMSNSTFSWWAQYLSRNENKIVYAPTPWHWGDYEKRDGMYLPYMRKIECHK